MPYYCFEPGCLSQPFDTCVTLEGHITARHRKSSAGHVAALDPFERLEQYVGQLKLIELLGDGPGIGSTRRLSMDRTGLLPGAEDAHTSLSEAALGLGPARQGHERLQPGRRPSNDARETPCPNTHSVQGSTSRGHRSSQDHRSHLPRIPE